MAPDPARIVDLDHRAFHLRGAPRQSLCVAAAEEGAITLVDVDSGRAESIAGLPKIRDLCPHPTRPLLAVIDDTTTTLSIVDFDGSRQLELGDTRLHKGGDEWPKPGFVGCFFDQAGSHLWTVARLAPDTVEIQLRETRRWSVVGSATVEDPFEESDCSFYETSRPDVAALWLAAGQDGQRVLWVTKLPDSLGVETDPFLQDTTPPVFSPGGNEFLVVDGLWSVCRYPYPTGRRLGTCRPKWGEEGYFGESLCFLDDTTALVQSQQGRLFRIDLGAMRVLDEVAVRGHEPRPVEEYYPRLIGDKTLCTDITSFTRIGEAVLLTFNREKGPDLGKWKDTLILYELSSLAGRTAPAKGL